MGDDNHQNTAAPDIDGAKEQTDNQRVTCLDKDIKRAHAHDICQMDQGKEYGRNNERSKSGFPALLHRPDHDSSENDLLENRRCQTCQDRSRKLRRTFELKSVADQMIKDIPQREQEGRQQQDKTVKRPAKAEKSVKNDHQNDTDQNTADLRT